jgi:hypothetical protein
MAELARFYGIVISIFFRDQDRHKRPHIHASYAEHAVSVAIDNGTVLAGRFPSPALHLVRDWLKRHRAQVQEAWRLASNGKNPGKIGKHSSKKNKKGKR